MNIAIIIIFIAGYLAITLEHPLKINKTASALFTGILIWTIYALGHYSEILHINKELGHHLMEISQILFFLLGAMTIVELVDAHDGFDIITDRIHTNNKHYLLWIIAGLTFFLSAVLDNLTTSIVMVSLLKKMIEKPGERKIFAGMVIIAANAGGAWSPIGDITTTMLWIGGQITTWNIVKQLFIPSLVCTIVPLICFSFTIKGKLLKKVRDDNKQHVKGSMVMLFFGIGALVFVPIFKTVTHLPPYMGMLLGLAVVWLVSELIHADKDEEERKPFTASQALSRIDTSSILFFLGILVAVGGLQSLDILNNLAVWMEQKVGNLDLIVVFLGIISSIFDNVPLVAAAMGMYSLEVFPQDHKVWEFMAYCAGTGGSMLIIGSASGVAVMGMEKIEFFWYIKRVTVFAFFGYIAGAITYLFLYEFLH